MCFLRYVLLPNEKTYKEAVVLPPKVYHYEPKIVGFKIYKKKGSKYNQPPVIRDPLGLTGPCHVAAPTSGDAISKTFTDCMILKEQAAPSAAASTAA